MVFEDFREAGTRFRLGRRQQGQRRATPVRPGVFTSQRDQPALAHGETQATDGVGQCDAVAIGCPGELAGRAGRRRTAREWPADEFKAAICTQREPGMGVGTVGAGQDALVNTSPVQRVLAGVHIGRCRRLGLRAVCGLVARAPGEQHGQHSGHKGR